MRNYKQGEPRTQREKKTSNKIEINDSFTPGYDEVRTVPNKGVVDAYYAHPANGHHLQSADPDVDMAVWGFNDQARQIQQEDRNKDETE